MPSLPKTTTRIKFSLTSIATNRTIINPRDQPPASRYPQLIRQNVPSTSEKGIHHDRPAHDPIG